MSRARAADGSCPAKPNRFSLRTSYRPAGDQAAAIAALCAGLEEGRREQVLLGVTGSGKTFTMANVIARAGLPSLVIAPNKTLAGQLHQEFRELFPDGAVEYFVSYYDYYQPEAYVPQTDTYIEKDTQINDEIDRLRHSATRALFERRDVIIVASVSCIYGLGSAEAYHGLLVLVREGDELDRDQLLRRLVGIQYERGDVDFRRGTFRVRGDVVEVFPASESERAVRIEFFGDQVERISSIDALTGGEAVTLDAAAIYPASHYVIDGDQVGRAVAGIRAELKARLVELKAADRLLHAQRLEERTLYDLEMLQETGTCSGIENYSRHLTGRLPGEPPPCLLDFFPGGFLLFIDESHITVPQIAGMFRGDRSRKETLVEYGFRLPSALDNRPLTFDEFNRRLDRVVYVSATPGDYELERTAGVFVEQVIRPTGLLDPPVEVRPTRGQIEDLVDLVRETTGRGERALVTTLTKRFAERLSDYLEELGIAVRYMHSDVHTIERMEIIRALREGEFDVLVGINLLREGLDLPEVSLVVILDADKEGFLRSRRSLIQTFGRAARNINGRVVMYADRETGAMREAMRETARRRELQAAFNRSHGIVPRSVSKAVRQTGAYLSAGKPESREDPGPEPPADRAALDRLILDLERSMFEKAAALEFEQAARLRDRLTMLKRAALAAD